MSTTGGPGPQLVFWPGSLGSRGLATLLEAASAGGYELMAISPLMLHQLLAAGRTAADIGAEAAASGVRLTQLDGVSSWAPSWYGSEPAPAIKERFDFAADHCLDLTSAFGLDSVLVAGAFDRGALPIDDLVGHFGAFCDKAAARGLRVELEFVPFWGIPDLATAWRIVAGADRPDSGLVIDTWQLQKGSPDLASDLRLLASIPAERLANVQLADATVARRGDSLCADGSFRLFPGDGELAIDQILATVAGVGGLRRIGTEIFGAAIDDLDAVTAGRRCAAATRNTLRGAVAK